jgi:hypothetical protein
MVHIFKQKQCDRWGLNAMTIWEEFGMQRFERVSMLRLLYVCYLVSAQLNKNSV